MPVLAGKCAGVSAGILSGVTFNLASCSDDFATAKELQHCPLAQRDNSSGTDECSFLSEN